MIENEIVKEKRIRIRKEKEKRSINKRKKLLTLLFGIEFPIFS